MRIPSGSRRSQTQHDGSAPRGVQALCRGYGDDAGGTRNNGQNDATSALPRRSDAKFRTAKLRNRFDLYMVNFLPIPPKGARKPSSESVFSRGLLEPGSF